MTRSSTLTRKGKLLGSCLILATFNWTAALKAQVQSFTFSFNQNYTVPACVTTMSFELYGGAGGNGLSGSVGGLGGKVTGVFTVTPGQVLSLYMGGAGGNASQTSSTGIAGAGGGNFGAAGGSSGPYAGGGGGGATDIRVSPYALANRLAVAGGGGGGGSAFASSSYAGGQGGGTSGGMGYSGGTQYSVCGGGGGSTVGGAGGSNGSCAAANGSFGSGGVGNCYGGGGGGGWYGGGGAAEGGGGGGSGYTDPMVTNVSHTSGLNAGNGKIVLRYNFIQTGSISATSTLMCQGNSNALSAPSGLQSYTWSTSANTQSILVMPSSSQTYSYQATATNGCSVTGSIYIIVSTGQPTIAVNASTTQICPGKSVTVAATGAQNYNWSGGISQSTPFSPSVTTTYSVTGTNGCGSATAAVTITVSNLTVTIIGSPTVCNGSAAILTSSPALGNYTWTSSSGGNYQGGSVYNTTPSVNTVYSLTAKDGTCAASSTYTVMVLTTPTVMLSTSATTLCMGQSATLTASGAGSYSWNPASISGSSAVVTPTALTLYSVTGSNTLGCLSSTSIVIFVNSNPNLFVSANKSFVCPGTAVTLSASGASNFTWTNGPLSSSYNITPSASAVYTVTGEAANGCQSSSTIQITTYQPAVSYSFSPAACIGKPLQIIASGASNYMWNNVPGSFIYTLIPSQSVAITLAASATSVGLTCSKTLTIHVLPAPNPTVSATLSQSVMCVNDALVIGLNGAGTYSWTSSAGSSAGSASTLALNTASAGAFSYSVTGTSSTGCTSTTLISYVVDLCLSVNKYAEVNLTVWPNPAQAIIHISGAGEEVFSLVDALGTMVKMSSLSGAHMIIDVSGLPDGLYYLVPFSSNAISVKKVLIQH